MEDEIPEWIASKHPEIKMEIDEFGRGFRKRKFISYIDTEPEWNIDGSYKRINQDTKSPKKHMKMDDSSEGETSEKNSSPIIYHTKNSSSSIGEADLSDIDDDAIYDPIND
jgi:hypothetical protein